MIKVMRHSKVLEIGAMVGIDPSSDGLARAKRLKVATTHEGLDGLTRRSHASPRDLHARWKAND